MKENEPGWHARAGEKCFCRMVVAGSVEDMQNASEEARNKGMDY